MWSGVPDADGELRRRLGTVGGNGVPSTDQIGLFERWQKNALDISCLKRERSSKYLVGRIVNKYARIGIAV